MDLPIQDIAHKGAPTICCTLWLVSFTRHHVFSPCFNPSWSIIECVSTSLPCVAKWYSIIETEIYHIIYIHLPVDGHSSCFHFLVLVNTGVQVPVGALNFSYLGCILRSDITGSYDDSVFWGTSPSFLKVRKLRIRKGQLFFSDHTY